MNRIDYPSNLTNQGDFSKHSELIETRFLDQSYIPNLVVDGDIPQGAVIQVGGVVYRADADEEITGTASDYVKIVPDGATATAEYVTDLAGVTWNKVYNGYYNATGELYLFDESKAMSNGDIASRKGRYLEVDANGRAKVVAPSASDDIARLDTVTSNIYTHPTHTARSVTNATGLVLSGLTSDTQGHVTGLTSKTLVAADIPNLAASKITSGVMSIARISQTQTSAKSTSFSSAGTYNATAPSVGQHRRHTFTNTNDSTRTVTLRVPTAGTYFVYHHNAPGTVQVVLGVLGASGNIFSSYSMPSTGSVAVYFVRIA